MIDPTLHADLIHAARNLLVYGSIGLVAIYFLCWTLFCWGKTR